MKKYLIVATLLLLTGCATGHPTAVTPDMDIQDMPDLPIYELGPNSGYGTVAKAYVASVQLCLDHDAMVTSRIKG